MQSIIKTAHSNPENMKNFLALLNAIAEKKTENNCMDEFIMQTKHIAQKSSKQALFWQALNIVATKINDTCNQVKALYDYDRKIYGRSQRYANHTRKLFQQYMQDLHKFQRHYPKDSFNVFSKMMAIIADKYDQVDQQEDINFESVDKEIAELIEESHRSIMLSQIYSKMDNNPAKLKEVTEEITGHHNSIGMKEKYELTDKEIRLLIDLEINRRQQAEREIKKEILQHYNTQVKEKRSAAAKKWYPGYGRYKTAAAVLGDCLLIVVPLINIFRFIRSGGGLWRKFNPVFSSKAHQDFEKSLAQEPSNQQKESADPSHTTYQLFNEKLLSNTNKAANQATIELKTTQTTDAPHQPDRTSSQLMLGIHGRNRRANTLSSVPQPSSLPQQIRRASMSGSD